MIKAAVLAVFFLAAGIETAQADFTQEIQRCDSDASHPDIKIVACTRNIKSGRFIGQNLAIAFTNRGLAYKKKGQWEKAIADFSEAINLKPDFVFAFSNRGNAYYGKVAEGEGFEPSIRLPVYTLSKRAPSATRPPLQECDRFKSLQFKTLIAL